MKTPYADYKPTTIPWLPKVPAHWEIHRAKYVFKPINERSENGDEQLLSVSEHRGVVPRKEANVTMFMAESYEGYKLCKKGDLAINSLWAWSRGLGFSEHAGIISTAYSVFRVREPQKIYYPYFNHLLRTKNYVGDYFVRSKGVWISRLILSDFSFLDIPVICPPYSEQKRIADFLDQKSALIDKFIKRKQRLISLVREQKQAMISRTITQGVWPNAKLKPSSIEGVEFLPAHWEIWKLKRIASVQGGVTVSAGQILSDAVELPFLRVANVQDGYLDLREVKTIQVERSQIGRYSLISGDILMNEGGDNDKLGRGCIWRGEIPVCLHQNHVFAVRVKKQCSPEWLNLITGSDYAKRYFLSQAKQTTNLASISSSKLGNLPVIIPSEIEQQEILSFVETESIQFDEAVRRIEQEIELAKEYKQSLIAEAVTGQFQVA